MRRVLAVAAVATLVAGCSMELTPEQQATLEREYRPVVNALIPACIATASGRKADYSGLKALGYTQRQAALGAGDYLYPAGESSIFSSDGIRFTPGEGCTAQDHGGRRVVGGLDDLGAVWVRALTAAGYSDTGNDNSRFEFTANGVQLEFRGYRNDDGIYFTIERE